LGGGRLLARRIARVQQQQQQQMVVAISRYPPRCKAATPDRQTKRGYRARNWGKTRSFLLLFELESSAFFRSSANMYYAIKMNAQDGAAKCKELLKNIRIC
jgi:hypothetical protein